VIIAAPYFAEYIFYIANHQGVAQVVETDQRFDLVPSALEAAIRPKTRVILLNSPNNPTGAVYGEAALKAVGEIIDRKSAEYGRAIYLLMDEPYRKLAYQGVQVPNVFAHVRRAIAVTSHSKDMNLPGERIGYIAIGPENEGAGDIFGAMTMANRILGFVNAPALFQRLVGPLQDVSCDMSVYAENRQILVDGLTAAGYDLVPPGGGFYLFPKSPIPDDVKFAAILKDLNVLVVPGAGFGGPGRFRIAFCVAPETCRRAVPLFAEALKTAG
jgi:aspartate aminotransferase